MLEVCELYKSLEGETQYSGLPCTFVRLAQCNLDCNYCDTPYAREPGEEMPVSQIMQEVQSFGIPLVCVTGGEPLLQEKTNELVETMLDQDFTVLLETNGTIDISSIDPRTTIIMDIKCPSSGMSEKTKWDNIEWLSPTDAVKFVIQDRKDFEWSGQFMKANDLENRVNVLFSPAFGILKPDQLADWILEKSFNIRLNLQLQNYIWPDKSRSR